MPGASLNKCQFQRLWRVTPRPGCQDSTMRWSILGDTVTVTSSVMSARNRWAGPGGALVRIALIRLGSVISSTVPATFASPFQSAGSAELLCNTNRGSRCRSSALTACHMLPNQRSPSTNRHSVPLIRGEPSRLNVASVLWRPASKNSRARLASSGTSSSKSLHFARVAGYTDVLSASLDATGRSRSINIKKGVE